MTVREIGGHLEELYGVDPLETVAEWQGRPLDACYPLVRRVASVNHSTLGVRLILTAFGFFAVGGVPPC